MELNKDSPPKDLAQVSLGDLLNKGVVEGLDKKNHGISSGDILGSIGNPMSDENHIGDSMSGGEDSDSSKTSHAIERAKIPKDLLEDIRASLDNQTLGSDANSHDKDNRAPTPTIIAGIPDNQQLGSGEPSHDKVDRAPTPTIAVVSPDNQQVESGEHSHDDDNRAHSHDKNNHAPNPEIIDDDVLSVMLNNALQIVQELHELLKTDDEVSKTSAVGLVSEVYEIITFLPIDRPAATRSTAALQMWVKNSSGPPEIVSATDVTLLLEIIQSLKAELQTAVTLVTARKETPADSSTVPKCVVNIMWVAGPNNHTSSVALPADLSQFTKLSAEQLYKAVSELPVDQF